MSIVNTCVTLHNICETYNDEYYELWEQEEGTVEVTYAQPDQAPHNSSGQEAKKKRDIIALNLDDNY